MFKKIKKSTELRIKNNIGNIKDTGILTRQGYTNPPLLFHFRPVVIIYRSYTINSQNNTIA